MQPYEYVVNILDNIKPDEIKTRQKHYEQLLLSLVILQPPVRTVFYTSAKITATPYKLDNSQNYIYIYHLIKHFI